MQQNSIISVCVSQIIFNTTKNIVGAIANDGYIYLRREVKSFTVADTIEALCELKAVTSELEIPDYTVSAIKCAAKQKKLTRYVYLSIYS